MIKAIKQWLRLSITDMIKNDNIMKAMMKWILFRVKMNRLINVNIKN